MDKKEKIIGGWYNEIDFRQAASAGTRCPKGADRRETLGMYLRNG